MPLKHELAWLVQERLEQMGILPGRLAELANVPTERVVALLARAEPEINVAEAERIANTVGLSLGVFGHQRSRDRAGAFVSAAREASTSFEIPVPADALRETLLSGVVSHEYRAHVRLLLDEASVGLLAAMADELQRELGVPQSESWRVMRLLASRLSCARELWV